MMRVCAVPGCPNLYPKSEGARCPTHRTEARRSRVGNDVYSSAGHRRFRAAVLHRDPVCVIPGCTNPATVADHYPKDRKQLEREGLDPNNPAHGRGLCHQHHSTETAKYQPGGWATPQ